jgi:hypothetical protein
MLMQLLFLVSVTGSREFRWDAEIERTTKAHDRSSPSMSGYD